MMLSQKSTVVVKLLHWYCYSVHRVGKHNVYAQRLIVAIVHGWDALERREASHLCHNGFCVAHDHLIAETPTQNAARGLCREIGNIDAAPSDDALEIADAEPNQRCPHSLKCFEPVLSDASRSVNEVSSFFALPLMRLCSLDRASEGATACSGGHSLRGRARVHQALSSAVRAHAEPPLINHGASVAR